MKNMKKYVAFVLCILSIVAVFAIASADGAHLSGRTSANEVKVGDTVTITVSMTETTVSSIGATVTADSAFEIVSGEWCKQGTIANFDKSKNKGAFAPGGATEIAGDIFKVTLKAKTAGASAKNVKIELVAKNGTSTLWTESVTQSVKIVCASHTFGAYTKTDAKHSRTCSACGYVESANHQMDAGKVTTEPTCTKEGVKTFTCSTCKHTKTEAVAKKAHTYGSWTKLNETQHEHKCSCGASEKANHNWGSWKTTDSTCAKEGSKTRTCADCKATQTESIAKKAHTYSNDCDTSCNSCGATRTTSHKYSSTWSTDSKNHWHQCSVCGDKKDNAAHTASDWIVDKNATEDAAGSKHKECTVCKKTLSTESIPATGCKHTAGTTVSGKKDATCTENGYTGDEVCKKCKTVMKKGSVITAPGHDTELVNAKNASCKEDGYTGDETCKKCKTVIKKGEVIQKGEHDYEITDAKDATCTEEGFTGNKTCKACEETVAGEVIEKLDHDFELTGAKDATCTEEGHTGNQVCKNCGETVNGESIAKLAHEFKDGTCKKCGATDPNYQPAEENNNTLLIIVICSVVVAAVAAGLIIFFIKRKRV